MTLDDLLIDEPVRLEETTDDLLVQALVDAQSYRLIAQEAIHALHRLQARYDRQQAAYRRTLDLLRQFRTELMQHQRAA